MINSLSSRLKSFVSSSKSNETDVTYHRKRKRENDERDQSDGEVEFVAEKKPKLERTSSQSSLFGGVLTTATLQNMSDWVQHKIPSFNMFSWKSKSNKPSVSHGNGQGVHGHGHQGQRGKPDRAGAVSVSRPSQNLHRDALRTSYDNRGSLPSGSYQSNQPPGPGSHQSSQPPGPGSYQSSQPPGLYQSSQPPGSFQSGMVNGEESEQPLTRPSIHESGSHALRKPPGSISGSSVAGSEAGSSIGSRKGLSRLYGRIFHTKQKEKFTATESVRLDDKVRYKELLQQFTTIPLEQETTSQRPENVKHPVRVPQLTRFYFKSNDSILGSTTSHSLKLPEKHDHTERPKIKVHPRERRTSHRPSSTQPVVNGDNVEDDSLMCVTDISAIHDIRGNNLPGSSKRISIDLTEDDDDVQIVSKHKPNASDYRESKFMTEDWIKDLTSQYNSKARERERQIVEEEIKAKLFDERRKAQDEDLEKRLRQQMQIYKREPAVTEELFEEEEEEEEKEEELPELTDDMQEKISNWLRPGQQVLIEKFKLQITRNDIATLAGLNWLNDEIINFYMNLLVERGEQDGNSKVYAFNTFFYPKILSGGQAAVKRWTRRVDVFAHDYILIPVHLGMHWCLAVVSFKKKQVQYYDSMGGNNVQCLNVIKKYLCDESIDKKKQEFNLQGWTTVVVKDIPQQMNGSDCGMFACKYAEYITRGAPITFTQQHMPYFRRRMVYEIVTGKLLQ